jgi:hypothetical protein
MTRLGMEYVLPLRWSDDGGLAELAAYVRRLAELVDVTVVDGSAAHLFARHAAAFGATVRHVAPQADLQFVNGKVNGVLTGLRLARHEHVVIADDDVRYDAAGLRTVDALLRRHDLVRPQNYFDPLPWHARWDTARTLLNRAVGADYPGTLAIRRSTFRAMGGYDGDVLFENLELIRTVRAYGGTEARPLDLYVRRLPPQARRFWSQRLRQAYDDLAQPARLATFLAIGPGLVAATALAPAVADGVWWPAGALGLAAAVALAERGRRRAGGAAVFPAGAALLAPVWVLERAACAWIALALRVGRRGVAYSGRRVLVAAHGQAELERRQRRLADSRRQPASRSLGRSPSSEPVPMPASAPARMPPSGLVPTPSLRPAPTPSFGPGRSAFSGPPARSAPES